MKGQHLALPSTLIEAELKHTTTAQHSTRTLYCPITCQQAQVLHSCQQGACNALPPEGLGNSHVAQVGTLLKG